MLFVPKLELSEFATHLCSGILIGECLKFLIEAWRLSWQQFSTNILWYWCHIVPSTVMHNDDRMASDKTARSSPTLAWFPVLLTYSFCQPWMAPPHPVTLGEWYGLCGVHCEVIWEETAFWAPSKNVIPSQLTWWLPHQSRLCWFLYLCNKTAPVWIPLEKHPINCLTHVQRASHCHCCCAIVNLVTDSCYLMRMCQGHVRGHVAALFGVALFHL